MYLTALSMSMFTQTNLRWGGSNHPRLAGYCSFSLFVCLFYAITFLLIYLDIQLQYSNPLVNIKRAF